MPVPNEDLPPDTSRSVASEKRPTKKRTVKAPTTPKAEPPADHHEGAPREGTKARRFWEYAQAFARGMHKATGERVTTPAVIGPQDWLVRLLRAHCRDEQDVLLTGPDVLTWIEDTAHAFRTTADSERVKYNGGWSPRGMAWWLDNRRPARDARQQVAAHIKVRRA
jgi:hypothetical protein